MVPSDQFPFKQFVDFSQLFPTFNPVQSDALQFLTSDRNLVLSSPTGSGKTEVAEMFIAEALSRQKKALYLVPFKAIGEEKFFGRWAQDRHGFSRLSKILMTGDYQMTEKRKQYLEVAQIIAATSEMLDHRTRHITSEKSKWIYEVGALIVDEAHLLTDGSEKGDGRGHKLECALMRFTQINPQARIILLSATMPNVEELSQWLTILTGRETDLYKSTYRPCQLNRHFVKYYDGKNTFARRALQMEQCIRLVLQYPQDQFLIFTSTKRWGRDLVSEMKLRRIDAEFHNADKRREELNGIESRFRSGHTRILLATQTLGAGVNLPARRVLIPHVTFGRNEDVPAYEIHQKEGRAGRLGYDTEGDSYILIPEKEQEHHMLRIEQGEKIISQLRNEIAFCFHLLGEIAYGYVSTIEDARGWYRRSLAFQQTQQWPQFPSLEQVFAILVQYKMLFMQDGVYHLTPLGKVCSMFYLHPIDVKSWYDNFAYLFQSGFRVEDATKANDVLVSLCLASVPSNENNFPDVDSIQFTGDTDEEYVSFAEYRTLARNANGHLLVTETGYKMGYLTYCLMNGINTGEINYSVIKGIEHDHERVLQAIQTMDGMVAHWDQEPFFKILNLRLNYKVPARYISLVQLRGVGKVRAHKLYNGGIKNIEEILQNPLQVTKLLGKTLGPKTVDIAKAFQYNNGTDQESLFQEEGVHRRL